MRNYPCMSSFEIFHTFLSRENFTRSSHKDIWEEQVMFKENDFCIIDNINVYGQKRNYPYNHVVLRKIR